MMKTIIFAAIVSAAPLQAEPVSSWSGSYFGVSGSAESISAENFIRGYQSDKFSDRSSNLAVGAFYGYNVIKGPWVLGAEIGIETQVGNTVTRVRTYSTEPWLEEFGLKRRYEVSLVGRAGRMSGESLVYGLAGIAIANFNGGYSSVGHPTASDTGSGFVIGAGLARPLDDKLSGRMELRYTDYSELDLRCSVCGPTFASPNIVSLKLGVAW